MIPENYLREWAAQAPWQSGSMVEQDLVISRSLVMLFSNAALAQRLAFRGGTALHKLHLAPASRYSEDIDLVQTEAGPIVVRVGTISLLCRGTAFRPRLAVSECEQPGDA
jgi:predicted nucleotidyltransferase component of viral defense system